MRDRKNIKYIWIVQYKIDKDIEAIRNDKKNKSATIIAIITSFGLFALLCTAIYKFGVAETTLNNFEKNDKSLATKEDIFNYYRTSEVKQNFSFDSINTNCLIYVKDFKNEFCSQLESVYHGSTRAGYYNDNSGNEYLVKFDTNGYVKTLYIGNFIDGKYVDTNVVV